MNQQRMDRFVENMIEIASARDEQIARIRQAAQSAIAILHAKAWNHAYESRRNLRDAKWTRNKGLINVRVYLARHERQRAHEARIAARRLMQAVTHG